MPELLVDFITSLDGYGAADGWPGWWGLEGPEYLAWLVEQPEGVVGRPAGAVQRHDETPRWCRTRHGHTPADLATGGGGELTLGEGRAVGTTAACDERPGGGGDEPGTEAQQRTSRGAGT